MILRLLAVTILGAALYNGTAHDDPTDEAVTETKTVKVYRVDARLRSAFLLRAIDAAGGTSPYARVPASPDEQLRAHFEAVDEILTKNTERSLTVAVDRYAKVKGGALTADERAAVRAMLARHRGIQLARLRAYRDRGLFPKNEGQSEGAAPIFVDWHDTACAVGYLMRRWGEEPDVDGISSANNLVYVTDVTDGPVIDWIIQSGLTQEEAALVQPAYGGTQHYTNGAFATNGIETVTLSLSINPYGKPAVGTGVLVQAEINDPPQFVTIQNFDIVSSGLVNVDAPATGIAGSLEDAPRVQRAPEALIANLFDPTETSDFSVDDSYWGGEITANVLGSGFFYGGEGDGRMGIDGGTHQFGTPIGNFDLIYLVVVDDEVSLTGEFAVGTTGPILSIDVDWYGIPVPEPSSCGLLLAGAALLMPGSRRGRRNRRI